MLVRDLHPEYFPKSSQSFEVPHRKLDTVHYVRKRPTKKMKRVKNFLDKQDINQDINKVKLDQELSGLFVKFDQQKRVREVSRAKKMQRKVNRLAINPPKQNLTTDMTNFLEYHEYVEMFALPQSNLYEKLRPKPGQNAEIFTRIYKQHKEQKLRILNEALKTNSHSTNKDLRDLSSSSKLNIELKEVEQEHPILDDSNFLDKTAPVIPKLDPLAFDYLDDYEKPRKKINLLENSDVKKLKEKGDSYTQYKPPELPRLNEYDIMGSKRTKALQLSYYKKLGILDSLKNRTPQKENSQSSNKIIRL